MKCNEWKSRALLKYRNKLRFINIEFMVIMKKYTVYNNIDVYNITYTGNDVDVFLFANIVNGIVYDNKPSNNKPIDTNYYFILQIFFVILLEKMKTK